MKKIIYTFLICTCIFNALAQSPTCDGSRYKNFVFSSVDTTDNIQYGQNYTMNNVFEKLMMDVYQPHGDVAAKRPLIILLHGGAFIEGTRQDMSYFCTVFALTGFVTATIDYRLIDVPLVDSTTVAGGLIRAVSDAKAAIRFFVQDAATSNSYKIDTNYIFIGGVSAGAITADHVAYLDTTDTIPPYISNLISANGGFKGNSSTNTSYSTPVKGVLNYSGSLGNKAWISKGEPALYSAHDNMDTIVPCNHGVSDAFPFPVFMDGSCAMQPEATLKGIYNDIFINNSSGHVAYFESYPLADTVLQRSADFLYNIICTNVLSVNDKEDNETKIQLYPNPATDQISIILPANHNMKEQIELFNSMGVLCKEMETNQSLQIDISDLPDGLYFLHLKNNPQQAEKFIKQ